MKTTMPRTVTDARANAVSRAAGGVAPAAGPTRKEIGAAFAKAGVFKKVGPSPSSMQFDTLLRSFQDRSRFTAIDLGQKKTAYVEKSGQAVYVYVATPGMNRDAIYRSSVSDIQAASKPRSMSRDFSLWSNEVRGAQQVFNGGATMGKARVTLTEIPSGYRLTIHLTEESRYLRPAQKSFSLSIPKASDKFAIEPGVLEFGHAEARPTQGGMLSAVIAETKNERRLSIGAFHIPRFDGSNQVISLRNLDGSNPGASLFSFPKLP